jgi:hypothetical protein
MLKSDKIIWKFDKLFYLCLNKLIEIVMAKDRNFKMKPKMVGNTQLLTKCRKSAVIQ